MNDSHNVSSCWLAHSVPGRLRLRCRQALPRQSQSSLQQSLTSSDGVLEVIVRSRTSSIIVRYERHRIDAETLRERIEQVLDKAFSDAAQPDVVHHDHSRSEPDSSRGSGRSRGLIVHGVTAAGLSAMLFVALVYRVFFRRPLPQTIFSLTGLVTIAGAVPLFQKAWQEWKAGRRMGLFPFLGLSSLIALLFGAASTALNIIWTLSLGMFLEELAMEKARRDVRAMVDTSPQTGRVMEHGAVVEKRVTDIQVGETLVVHAGWGIAADGVVTSGQAMVNESKITGHQLPALRAEGDSVYGGTTVQEGSILIKVSRSGRDTYLSKVIDLVEQALEARSEVERKADELAARMVKVGSISTAGTFVITRSLSSTVAVLLVMSCPCATILAASTAVTASIASAARRNILIKSGSALETMAAVDCLCFDKTGTLTKQLPELASIQPRSPWIPEDRILQLAAGAEASSQHPIARALVQTARARGVKPEQVANTEVVIGRGVRGSIGNEELVVGNAAFMEDCSVNISYFKKSAAEHLEHGRSPVYVAKDAKAQGMLVLETKSLPESAEVLDWLRNHGVSRLSLVSGDDHSVVQPLCALLPFDECLGNLGPEEKTTLIKELQGQGSAVCMVGDGVNDALALSTANVGVAIGAGGADAALEAADIVLMGENLQDIVLLRSLSLRSMRIVEQNFWIGAGSDYIGLGLGLLGLLTPLLGGIIHVGHTLAIMLNSSRLLAGGEAEAGPG